MDSYFWSEGSALVQVREGRRRDPKTISARAYLAELRDAYRKSARGLNQALKAGRA